MNDGDKNKNMEKISPRQPFSSFFNVVSIFQSIWIRCRSIFPNITNRKFMEGEFYLVLYCGIVLWFIFLLSKIV